MTHIGQRDTFSHRDSWTNIAGKSRGSRPSTIKKKKKNKFIIKTLTVAFSGGLTRTEGQRAQQQPAGGAKESVHHRNPAL